jgi:aminomethyltransferase
MSDPMPQTLSELCEVLRPEHELLGARFGHLDKIAAMIPLSYVCPEEEEGAFNKKAALVDLSGLPTILQSGKTAVPFTEMTYAGNKLAVGQCAFEALLLGDGTLASISLLARSGDKEFISWCVPVRAAVTFAWLQFLLRSAGKTGQPFQGLEIHDVSSKLLPLLLAGPSSSNVLSDYLGEQQLPTSGQAANLYLDKILCLVVALPAALAPSYLLLVPPVAARVLWRSLLSFQEVVPVGRLAAKAWAEDVLPWLTWVSTKDQVIKSMSELHDAQVLRSGHDFIGARGLLSR